MKNYCEKCKKIDKDCAVIVDLQATTMNYTNLKKGLLPEFIEIENILNHNFAKLRKISLCHICFNEFFNYVNPELLNNTPPSISGIE